TDELADRDAEVGEERREDRFAAAVGHLSSVRHRSRRITWSQAPGPPSATLAGSLLTMSPLEAMAAESGGANASEPIVSVTPEALDHLRELRDDEVDGDKLGLRLAI